jgi:hypothetical protein
MEFIFIIILLISFTVCVNLLADLFLSVFYVICVIDVCEVCICVLSCFSVTATKQNQFAV